VDDLLPLCVILLYIHMLHTYFVYALHNTLHLHLYDISWHVLLPLYYVRSDLLICDISCKI
jgi:hypothetical protein